VLAAAVLLRRPEAGLVLRNVPVRGGPSVLAVDAQSGRAFVLSTGYSPAGYRGYVTVLDTATGALLHTEPVGRMPTDMVLDQRTNRIFITDNATGTVSVLDAASGRLLQTTAVGVLALPGGSAASLEPLGLRRIALDARSNRVFVSAMASFRHQLPFGGAVRVFDARTGYLLRTVRTGGGALVVDDRTGRVFVASIDGDGVTMLDAHSGAVLRTIPGIGKVPWRWMRGPDTSLCRARGG
jgi:DNA-binding beta-propeller fold protein YncE